MPGDTGGADRPPQVGKPETLEEARVWIIQALTGTDIDFRDRLDKARGLGSQEGAPVQDRLDYSCLDALQRIIGWRSGPREASNEAGVETIEQARRWIIEALTGTDPEIEQRSEAAKRQGLEKEATAQGKINASSWDTLQQIIKWRTGPR